jgi:hypothetical protein
MTHDYEDIFDVDDLEPEELRRIVHETLRETKSINAAAITVHVHDDAVILAGRVGTQEEQRIAERVVADRIGLQHVRNQLIVDSLYRAESPEAIDEHLVDEHEHESLLLGGRIGQDNDEASHLEIDYEGELYGTVDRTEAMETGIPWIPPESPTPEGMNGMGPARDAHRDAY